MRVATWVMTSTGLVAMTSTASGAAARICGTTSWNTAALRSSSSSRVSPGRWLTPAAMITAPAPARSG